MTKERLEAYRSMLDEEAELRERLEVLKEDEGLFVADTVLDYKTGHGIPRHIAGISQERYWSRRQRYESRISELMNECMEIEDWVDRIADNRTRSIFMMVYLDGLSQAEVGKRLHLDRSRISRRIKEYLNRDVENPDNKE